MTLWTPKKTKVAKIPQAAVDRSGSGYGLPVEILDWDSMTLEDEELLDALNEYQPNTNLKAGDLAYLQRCPPSLKDRLKLQGRLVPLVWKVRFVVSAWAFNLHNVAHSYPNKIVGIDHAVSLLEQEGSLRESQFDHPVIYAHAMPHGLWPDTAHWFPGASLRKVVVRDTNPEWPVVLDEAKAPFVGYDTDRILRPFVWKMAPDLYASGENLGQPLPSEEAAIHTACLLGMETMLLGDLSRGVDPYYVGNPHVVDPHHDLFGKK